MSATTRRSSTRGRMPPPPRGRRYYDVDRGVTMIVPPGGGKAVPVEPRSPRRFDGRGVLRRTGLLSRDLGRELVDDTARGAQAVAERGPFNLGAAGGMVVSFAAAILGLLFLDLLLSPRGSGVVAGALSPRGPLLRGIGALANPYDPLFGASTPGTEQVPRSGRAQRTSVAMTTSAPPAEPILRPTGPEWGGAKSIADRLAQVAIGAGGLAVTSTKREKKATASGGVSDHWTGSTSSYAYDLAGTVAGMDKAAAAVMAALGRSWDGSSGIVENVTRFGYRVQVIYRTNVGGNHYDHIHIGVRKET